MHAPAPRAPLRRGNARQHGPTPTAALTSTGATAPMAPAHSAGWGKLGRSTCCAGAPRSRVPGGRLLAPEP
eukprot:5179779-Lingulodinium_polyedra.AAC.1